MALRLYNCWQRVKMALECISAGRYDILCYKIRIYRKKVDFCQVSVEELDLPECVANYYSDSGGPDLALVAKAICVPKGSRAIDIGSGKGGAVFTLGEYPFEEVVGVEISKDLIRIAEENRVRLGLRNVRFICCDARAFTEYDSYSHIYMYNPFPCNVMSDVLCNVSESLKRKPRSLTLIYKNPVCHGEIIDSGLFSLQREYKFRKCHHPFRVYYHPADGMPCIA
jgi:hypothetical protein